MALVTTSRLRSDRLIRTLLISAIFLLGVYTLFIWTDSSVGISVKPFRLEFDFDYRYAYADEDESEESLLRSGDNTGSATSTGSHHVSLKPRSASERLIASGEGFCENWTVPEDEEEVARREQESSCWKDRHYRQLKFFLDNAETDKSYSELS